MKIKVKNKESGVTLTLSTGAPASEPDERVKVSVTSDDSGLFVEDLINSLNESYGFYGHIVNVGNTTNLDLYTACKKLSDFEFISSDGVPQAKADTFPPDAVG